MSLLLLGANQFNVKRDLFSNNEQGLWLDPSDMTAGKAAWRRNLLTYSEMFSHANWIKQGSLSVTPNTDIGVDGLLTADTLTNTGVSNAAAYQAVSMEAGVYTFRVWVKAGTATQVTLTAWRSGPGLFASTTVSGLTSEYQEVTLTINNAAAGSVLVYIYPNSPAATSGSIVVARAMLVAGSTIETYQPITDFSTEFKAAFPTHTLYQDSNGVTPCTAAGDPVGLILDQSRGGLGALGAEIVTNGGLSDATGWTVSGASPPSITGGQAVWSGSTGEIQWASSLTVGKWYKLEFDLVSYTSGNLNFRDGTTNTLVATTGAVAGRKTFFINATSNQIRFISFSSATLTIDNISVREVPGNHAYQTTSSARPTLQTSGGLWYLSFDGSDDSLVTNSVNFSGTDEMTVIAGVRKLSDAASAAFVEASADAGSNSGAFAVYAPRIANAAVEYRSRGTLTVTANEGIASAAPTTLVFTGQSDISDDSLTVRKNGVQAGSSAGDQGTGNYGNYQLFIGRRNQATLPYNGHIYQLIVRGKTTPTGKLLEAERFVARKTGVSF